MQKDTKIVPLEIKSSASKKHESIDNFNTKYSKHVAELYLFSQKDVGHDNELKLKPIYMLPFVLEDL